MLSQQTFKAHAVISMGGLCSSMADFVVAAAGVAGGGERPAKKAAGENESWEDEVNMDVFYTDATKYWEVNMTLFECTIVVCARAGDTIYSGRHVGWLW